MDLVIGPDFYTVICFTPKYKAKIFAQNKLDIPYLYDSYIIEFWYNKKKDPSNCYLKIKGGGIMMLHILYPMTTTMEFLHIP